MCERQSAKVLIGFNEAVSTPEWRVALDSVRNSRKRRAAKRYLTRMDCARLYNPATTTSDFVYLCKLVRDANRGD